MPYKIKFKSRLTKNKWVEQVVTHRTLATAKSTAKYMKRQHDPKGKLVKTQVKITKVEKKKKRKKKRK